MDLLLRAKGKTGYVLTGTILVLVINVTLMVVLYRQLGLIGPAIALITAEIALEVYYGSHVAREYGVRITNLIDWRGMGRVMVGYLVDLPVLIAASYTSGTSAIIYALIASLLFTVISWWVAYRLGVEDIGRLARFAFSIPKRMWRRQ